MGDLCGNSPLAFTFPTNVPGQKQTNQRDAVLALWKNHLVYGAEDILLHVLEKGKNNTVV